MVRKMGGKQNENLKKLICAGIVILAIAGCAKANFVDSNTIVQDGIEYYMQTDKAVYDLGENVEMLYRVTNLGNEDVTFGFTAGPVNDRGDFIVEENGESIWDNLRRPRLRVLTQFTLSPLEFRDFTHLWDMTDSGGHQVTPGNYDVTGALGNLRLAYMDKYIPVSVPIQIIPEPAMIYYVDADANGLNDGSSWANAYNYLQDALAAAASGDEIHVAEGIYNPSEHCLPATPPSIPPPSIDPQACTFQLINGVTLKGGYAGFGEPDPNARDIELYETILTGDLNGDDSLGFYKNRPVFHNNYENSYHVVTGSGTDETAVLDGFTITGGNAHGNFYSGDPRLYGGGMYNNHSSPTLLNCTFSGNSADKRGGGMDNNNDSSPILSNCTFSRNSSNWGGGGMRNSHSSPTLTNCVFSENSAAFSGGGMRNENSSPTLTKCVFTGNSATSGGGMYNTENSSPTLTNCTFARNLATKSYFGAGTGGGMRNSHSSPTLVNCIFSGNSAYSHGGGMINVEVGPTLTNCTFTGNSATDNGGGMYNARCSSLTLTNCTFATNSASNGNALACDSYQQKYPSSVEITNCILRDDGNEIWNNDNSVITITYSDIFGGSSGLGNIDADPCFVQPGYWDPNGTPDDANDDFWVDGDYHLLEGSPCIDAGDPNYVAEPNETDLDGRPRIVGGRIDMGAYEYSPPVPAEVRIVPSTINLASKGKWITCYIWLGEDYNVADIDPNSILLEDEIEARSLLVDEQEQVAIVRFDRSEAQGILAPGEVELTVSGELTDGTRFEGTDTIRVIDKGGKK